MSVDAPRSVDPAELVAAIRNGEIRPLYMAIVDLATERPVAVEALARWYRRSGEVVAPDDFVPLAEASDLVLELDLAVAAQAFGDLGRWQRGGLDLRVSVNLSGRHLAAPESVQRLADLAARAGVDPAAVVLELTETVRPDDAELAADVAHRLRAEGFSLWLDDFGSGLANLGDLVELPLDGIKLDRPFARNLGRPAADAVVGAAARLGAELGLVVTLEGIEEAHQAARARELGCDLGQGLLWPHGLGADQVAALF